MVMDPVIVAGVFGIVGVGVGALLQHRLGRTAEVERFRRQLRTEAYAAYLEAIGKSEQLHTTMDANRHADITAAAILAKARICAFGASTVVTALAAFEGSKEPGLTPAKKVLLLDLIQAMRRDAVGEGDIDLQSIERVLFHA